jgi:tetratricopeptide (TPR) repeat protein
LIEEFDSPTGNQGPEAVSLVAAVSGDYRVEVKPFDPRAQAARYEIELEEIRDAEPRDKEYEAARRHSKALANNLVAAVQKRDDNEVVQRFREAAVELGHPAAQPDVLYSRAMEAVQLPLAYRERGDHLRAVALATMLVDIAEKNLGANNLVFGSALSTAVQLELDMANIERAESLLAKAAPFLDNGGGQSSLSLAFLQEKAKLYGEKGEFRAAQTTYQRVLTELEQRSGTNNIYSVMAFINLAEAYALDENYSVAETTYRRAIAILERIAPTNYIGGYAYEGLGEMYVKQKKYSEAEPLLQQAARSLGQHYGLSHPETATVEALLATDQLMLGRDSDALPLFERAVKNLESSFGPESPRLIGVWESWAGALTQSGKPEAAADAAGHASRIRSSRKPN